MHTHTQYSTKKKKLCCMFFRLQKHSVSLCSLQKTKIPKPGKRDWVGRWESLCQTQIFLQLRMLSRALSLPQYTHSPWHLMWQHSAMVAGEAPPQSNSDSAASSPWPCSLGSRCATSGGSAHCRLTNRCFAAFSLTLQNPALAQE